MASVFVASKYYTCNSRKVIPRNEVWDRNSRKFVPAKREKSKILELKLPRKFHATGFPAEEYYKNLLSFPLDSNWSDRLCYPLHCCSSNHINIKKKNPADKQFLLSVVVRKLRWLEAYLSFISCFFCLKVLCSCERRFILKPVKVRATCGMVSGKKTLTSCSVSFDDDREDSLVPGPFRARTWAGGPMTLGWDLEVSVPVWPPCWYSLHFLFKTIMAVTHLVIAPL